MESAKRELLMQYGFDVEGAMRRFLNNEQLYKKCLKKLLSDESMEKLMKAYHKGAVEDAFKAAHTMKGFVSNLGIEKLHQLLIPLVEELRGGSMPEQAKILQLEEVYREIYELIENM